MTITPATVSLLTGGSQDFSASVINDAAGKGVTWSITGCTGGAVTCGSLTRMTSTTATYTAPESLGAPVRLAIAAVSVADPTRFSAASVAIAVTAITVSVTPTTASLAVNTTQVFNATVANGPARAGVTWSITGCSGGAAVCGSLTVVTSLTATYTAPATVPPGGLVGVTATSVADNTTSATASVTIIAAGSVSVTVSPATANVQTGGSQDFSATVTNDPAAKGVTWSITGCTGGAGTCGSLTNITHASVTYTAPSTVPPGGLGVTATSVANNTRSSTASVTVVTVFATGMVHVSAAITTYGAGPYPLDSLRVCDLTAQIQTPRGFRTTCAAGHSYDVPFPGDVSFPSVPGMDTLRVTGFAPIRVPYRCDPLQSSILVAVDSGQTAEATFKFACPAPASTSGVIAFVGDFDGDAIQDVYAVAADGSGLTNLTNSRQPNKYNPAWSPDGTHVAFIEGYYLGGTGSLYIMNADGSGVTLLPQPSSVYASIGASTPAWSPDNSRLALVYSVNDPAGGQAVYVMNADGSNATALTSDLGHYYGAPTWSPDGTKIAFSRGSGWGGWGDVFVMNADGSGLTQVTHDGHSGTPSWSPDGRQIAYAFADSTGNGGLFLMNPDGSGVTRLTSDSSVTPPAADEPTLGAAEPSWSPTGTQIAFTRGVLTVNPGYWVRHVFVVNADGTGLRDLTNTYSDVHTPSWKP